MRRFPTRRVFGVGLLSTLLLAFAPAVALADDITNIGQTAEQTTQTVGDTAEQTTQTVGDTADQTTQTVGETAEQATQTVNQTTEQTTQTVGDTADQTTQTVGETAEQATQTVGEAGSALDSDGAGGSVGLQSATSDPNGRSNDEVDSGRVRPGPGSHASTLESDSGNTPSELFSTMTKDNRIPESDPCHDDSRLVCLGVLFGLGKFADTGAEVLGALVKTGGVVVFLGALALLFAILGAATLAASSSRVGYELKRAD
jgi:hypothetical protein